MTERAVNLAPVFILLRGCNAAVRALSAVSVGERSTLPG